MESVGWRHWPSSAALFMGEFPGVVRCAPLNIFGRTTTEGPLLHAIRAADESSEKGTSSPCAVAARSERSGAVTGLAAWGWDALWPGTCLVDIYCHPEHWQTAGQLLSALRPPAADRCVACADSDCRPKHEVLREAGFRPASKLEGWVAAPFGHKRVKTRTLDVQVYRRT